MILSPEISGGVRRLVFAGFVASSAVGCQTNPMYWPDGTKVEVLPDKSFVVSLSSEKVASLGGPTSEKAQEFLRAGLAEKGCVLAAPIESGERAWGGYWYAKGKCK